jgi:prefoldin alpha subunit
MDQQNIMQAQMIEQEINQLNQQFQLIEQNIRELQNIELSLIEIEKEKTKEILINLGKGIYLPVDIKEKKLIIEVGGKNLVKKDPKETKEIIKDQIEKLTGAKIQVQERLESLYAEINNLLTSYEQKQEKEMKDSAKK